MDAHTLGGLYLVVVLLGVLVLILWILLPFAVFGMKPLLRRLIAESEKTNVLLSKFAESAKANVPLSKFAESKDSNVLLSKLAER